jgi:hypothetical protein
MWRALVISFSVAGAAALAGHAVFAQPLHGMQAPTHDGQPPTHGGAPHDLMHSAQHGQTSSTPSMPGQDAFGAIAEVVRLLDADPKTDWATVDLERLRQHLIDMNEVVLRSEVKQTPVPGGLAMEITGTGRTERAIRAMVVPHAAELDRMPEWSARTEPIAGGLRLIVVAKKPDDAKTLARIRGLGFAGLITEGAHHQPHHLAMAKGEALGHTH